MYKKFTIRLKDFIIDDITYGKLFRIFSDKQIVLIDYLIKFGKLPNLDAPVTISEKIEWTKLYGNLERYCCYVDKYKVRKFITETIGSKYLVPLLGVWDKFDDIDFDRLPQKFVIKATHGSGYNYICKDKSLVNKRELKKKVEGWLQENFYKKTREIQYNHCVPKIICEKYLQDETGELTDYKYYCFDGKPEVIEIHSNRFTNHKLDYADIKFNRLPMKGSILPQSSDIKKPGNFVEMARIARVLSSGFPFVRVDLYSVKGKTCFGELTFTPGNGLLAFNPPDFRVRLGELINLSEYKGANTQINHV